MEVDVDVRPVSVDVWPVSVEVRPVSVEVRPVSVEVRPVSVTEIHREIIVEKDYGIEKLALVLEKFLERLVYCGNSAVILRQFRGIFATASN